MAGIMVNFNNPDNNDADMFSKMESDISLQFTEVENGYRLVFFTFDLSLCKHFFNLASN